MVYDKIILDLVDVALKADKRTIEMSIRKLASKVRSSNSRLYEEISSKLKTEMLRSVKTKSSPLPVDSDSRQTLVKLEDPVFMDKPPIQSKNHKALFNQILLERQHFDALLNEGLHPTRSIIFQGPPGVGKTMSARWLASKLDLPLLTLDLATVMSSFLGKTGSNVRSVLEYATSFPCVLLLDEFDAIAKRRDDDRELGELKRLVTVLLQTIDEWPDVSILVAATNHSELLDPAIWRRFDAEIKFEIPSECMIREYLHAYWPGIDNFDEEKFLGMSFSDISRKLIQEKRERIISGISPEYFSTSILGKNLKDMPLSEKKKLVPSLKNEGLSQRAIADKLGISRPTVKKALESST